MRETMRDGNKASRAVSKRSKATKQSLGRVGTTSSCPAFARAPSSMHAALAAGAAIDRHGTPMHQASIKPRDSPAKPQPVRRPSRNNIPPSTIFEDIDLEAGSMTSMASSNGSSSTGPWKRSFDISSYDDVPLDVFQRNQPPGTGHGRPPPRSGEPSRGCWGAIKDFWVLWNEVDRMGLSEEALAIEMFRKRFGSKERDLERDISQGFAPQTSASRSGQVVQLRHFCSESSGRNHAIPTIVEPTAAMTRSGSQRVVPTPQRASTAMSDVTDVTTWTEVMRRAGAAPKQAPPASSGLRQQVRNDSPQNASGSHGRTKQREESPSRIRYPPQTQPPYPYENCHFNRDDEIDQGSHIGGFSDFDGTHRAPTIMSTRAPTMATSVANMSYIDPADWHSVHHHQDRRPKPISSRIRAPSLSDSESEYSRATDGRAYTHQGQAPSRMQGEIRKKTRP